MTILYILVAALSVMLISLAGAAFASRTLGAWMGRNLTYLATFAAGVLAILAYHLVKEVLYEGNAIVVVASVIAGAVVLELIHNLLPHEHHHHGETDHTHSQIDGRRVLLTDAVHNVTDGFIIVPAFLVNPLVGWAATLGILLHELVQEISEYFILREAGYTVKKALALNFTVSATLLVGIALALLLSSLESVLTLLAGFAAGGFLSVVLRDLLPHTVQTIKARGGGIFHAAAALIGAALMFGVIAFTP